MNLKFCPFITSIACKPMSSSSSDLLSERLWQVLKTKLQAPVVREGADETPRLCRRVRA